MQNFVLQGMPNSLVAYIYVYL